MTCGVAVISSVVTVTALASAGKHDVVQTGGDQCERGAGKLYTVSSAVTPPTDFTHASENTINGVVSIKSYATSRGNSGMDGYNSFSSGCRGSVCHVSISQRLKSVSVVSDRA